MAWSDAARRAAAEARRLRAEVQIARGTPEREVANRVLRINRGRVGSRAAYAGALRHVADARRAAGRASSARPSLAGELASRGRSSGLTPREAALRRKIRGY